MQLSLEKIEGVAAGRVGGIEENGLGLRSELPPQRGQVILHLVGRGGPDEGEHRLLR
jgi:hypothetical protein